MTTKKELSEQFNLNVKTVSKTLEKCGLDTAKADYSEGEVARFAEARRLITEEHKSYDEVAVHFGVTADETAHSNGFESPASASFDKDDPLQNLVAKEVQNYVQEVTDEAVNEAITLLPQMIMASAKKAVQSGAVSEVFRQMADVRKEYAQTRSHGMRTVQVSPEAELPFADDDEDGGEEGTERQWEPQE